MKKDIIKILAICFLVLTTLQFKNTQINAYGFDIEDYVDNILAREINAEPAVLGVSQTLLAHPAAPVLAAPPTLFSIDGEVIGVNDETADDIVVFVRIVDMDGAGSTGSSTWASTTLQTVDGRYLWEADLGGVRSSDFSEYFIYSSNDRFEVEIFGPGGLLTQYIGDIADVEAHDPLSAEPIVPAINILPETGDAAGRAELRILTPTTDQIISQSRPTFTGSGPANTLLDIYIVGTNIRANVDTGENGNWSWTPGSDIPAGEHVLRIEYTDARGEVLSAEQKFSVISSPETGSPQSFFIFSIIIGAALITWGAYSFGRKEKGLAF